MFVGTLHSVTDSYEDDPDAPGEKRLCSSTIRPPLEISVTEEEQRLFRCVFQHVHFYLPQTFCFQSENKGPLLWKIRSIEVF